MTEASRAGSRRHVALARPTTVVAAMLAAVALASCGGSGTDADGLCDPADVQSALDAARPGESIRLGACRIEGPLVVPAQVSLVGAGRGRTILHASAGDVLTVDTGETRTISDLTIESDGERGLATRTFGLVDVVRVDVRASRGIGVDLTGSHLATLTDVDIGGPVTRENASAISADPSADGTATVGLDAGSSAGGPDFVGLERVSVHGFARVGVWFNGVSAVWTGGSASDNLGTAILIQNTGIDLDVRLADIEVCRTMLGRQPASYGIVAAGSAFSTSGVSVCDGDGHGIVQTQTFVVVHDRLSATGNAGPGAWIQGGFDGTTSIVGSTLAGNAVAGVVVITAAADGPSTLDVARSTIELTAVGEAMSSDGALIEVGDGLHVVQPSTVALHDVTLTANARVGILLDAADATTMPPGLTFERVTVDATGEGHGALLQNATGLVAPGAWDSGITRTGAATSDAAVTARFDVLAPIPSALLPQ